jgi:hypothetical protein
MERHRVYFYEEDSSLSEPIGQFVKEGLDQKQTVIVIATDQRRFDLKKRLLADNIIGLSAPHDDQYVTLDASTTYLFLCVTAGRMSVSSLVSLVTWSDRHTKIRRYVFTKESPLFCWQTEII